MTIKRVVLPVDSTSVQVKDVHSNNIYAYEYGGGIYLCHDCVNQTAAKMACGSNTVKYCTASLKDVLRARKLVHTPKFRSVRAWCEDRLNCGRKVFEFSSMKDFLTWMIEEHEA